MRLSAGFIVLGSVAALTLGGCASMVNGGMQTVSVRTVGPHGAVVAANCELMNSKGSSFVPATPNAAEVYRDSKALSIVCNKAGLPEAKLTVKPQLSKVDVANMLSAGIGQGIDMADGDGYAYPSHVVVHMGTSHGLASIEEPKTEAKG